MNMLEVENFYAQDKQKYNISKNKELLIWWKNKINNGYNSYIDIEVVQDLIDNIANWYEIKYPEREMIQTEGVSWGDDFKNIEPLSQFMNINQLLYRLPGHQLSLMECGYYANGCVAKPVHNEQGQVIEHKVETGIKIYEKNQDDSSSFNKVPYFYIFADSENGVVNSSRNLKEYIDTDVNITLEELLVILKDKYNDKLNLINLENCVYNHNCDVELRNKILELVALKLLYSKNTRPHRGYERAKRFIDEFNKELGLSLSTEEIDLAFNKDYSTKETENKVEDNSYCVVENNKKKSGKVRSLVKSVLKK